MEAERAAERDFVMRAARENDVKFIRLWFTDILGHLKGFAITVEDPVSYTHLTLPTTPYV